MSPLRAIILLVALLAASLAGCLTTPVPVPPTFDPDNAHLDYDPEIDSPLVQIVAGPGTIDPPDTLIRITNAEDEVSPEPFVELMPSPDGSFSVTAPGFGATRYFIEAITEDDDLFLAAIGGGVGAVVIVDAGPDSDGDGSPDAIDCAPEDDRYRGRRCP